MQAKELKEYLLSDTDRILKALESFGFHDMWFANEEIRCCTPNGDNRTSVAIKLSEELFATCYSNELSYRGDFFGLLQEFSKQDFSYVMRKIHHMFGLQMSKSKEKKSVDLLKDIRRFKKRSKGTDVENAKFERTILKKYLKLPHASLIEEAISPAVLDYYDVHFDPIGDRIVFPHFDWEEHDKVVGLKARSTMSGELCKEMNIPKYTNYIKGYLKTKNLYGYSHVSENIEEAGMLILFEAEKSVLKHSTIHKGKGFSVALGGHVASSQQIEFIIKNTSIDVEIVLAMDKDVMTNEESNEEVLELCKRIAKYRKCSYVFDKYGITGEKDSPIDRGYKRWSYLLKHRVQVAAY